MEKMMVNAPVLASLVNRFNRTRNIPPTVLIIGASGDIGIACAKRLTATHNVLLHYYHHPIDLKHIDSSTNQRSPDSYYADITNPSDVKEMMNAIKRKYKQIDSLIFTSGAGLEPAGWESINSDIFNKTIDINVTGVFNCIQKVAPIMLKQQQGSIVVIGSTAGLSGSTDCIAYSVAKAGLLNMSTAFAKKLAHHHININVISPTWTNTKWHQHKPSSFRKMITTTIPMGRMVEPHEIAETVAFLINPINRMITGQNIVIDGGLHL